LLARIEVEIPQNRRIILGDGANAFFAGVFVMAKAATAAKAPKPAKVDPVPKGTHTVTPHLICAGAADAIAFYTKAFGAKEMFRLPAANGKLVHATVKIGDSTVMLVDEMPQWGAHGPVALKGTPVTLHLAVEDVDAWVARAVAAGAKLTMPVQDMFWGDRYGVVEDPFGHKWSIATHIKDLTPEEVSAAMPKGMGG
jgi:PhnB protein